MVLDIKDNIHTGILAGGFGLELCREGLSLSNVSLVSAWKGLIKKITVVACNAAQTAPRNENTVADGKHFMIQMAIYSGAEVIASRDTQHYENQEDHWFGSPTITTIEFRPWEGTVYRFDPKGGPPMLVFPGTVK